MAEKVEFELVSPERLIRSELVDMVVVPGTDGDFGALPRHAPMITSVRPGVIDVYVDGKIKDRIFVAGGFADVNEIGVTVLAEEAFALADVTLEAAAERLAAAEASLQSAADAHHTALAQRSVAVARALQQALTTRSH